MTTGGEKENESLTGSSQKRMGAQRALTALPEAGEVRCRFDFVFIGPQAKVCANRCVLCEENTSHDAENSDDGEQTEVQCGRSQGSQFSDQSTSAWNGDKIIFCEVGRGDSCGIIARLKVRCVESFSDAVQDLKTEDDIQCTCYVFLWDARTDLDVLSSLESRRVEVNFMHDRVKKKWTRMKPVTKPRIAFLRHACEPGEGKAQDTAVASFERKLAAKNALKKTDQEVDFDDELEFYEVIREIATEMYRLNIGSASRSIRFSHASSAQQRSSCCVVS